MDISIYRVDGRRQYGLREISESLSDFRSHFRHPLTQIGVIKPNRVPVANLNEVHQTIFKRFLSLRLFLQEQMTVGYGVTILHGRQGNESSPPFSLSRSSHIINRHVSNRPLGQFLSAGEPDGKDGDGQGDEQPMGKGDSPCLVHFPSFSECPRPPVK
jgi:hypothetical protein